VAAGARARGRAAAFRARAWQLLPDAGRFCVCGSSNRTLLIHPLSRQVLAVFPRDRPAARAAVGRWLVAYCYAAKWALREEGPQRADLEGWLPPRELNALVGGGCLEWVRPSSRGRAGRRGAEGAACARRGRSWGLLRVGANGATCAPCFGTHWSSPLTGIRLHQLPNPWQLCYALLTRFPPHCLATGELQMAAKDGPQFAILVLSHTLKAHLAGVQLVKLMESMWVGRGPGWRAGALRARGRA
jgi:hypothetical protein